MSAHPLHKVCFALCLVCLLAGCTREAMPEPGVPMVSVPLSLSVAEGVPQTRLTDDIVQTGSPTVFRGIEKIEIIPFYTDGGAVAADDYRWSANLLLPQRDIPANTFGTDALGGSFEGLVTISNAHLYDVVYVPVSTNHVLVYGHAPDVQIVIPDGADSLEYKRYNGVLRRNRSFDELRQPGELSFSLEPYLSGDRSTLYTNWRKNLVNSYLNPIVQASRTNKKVKPSVTYRFNDPAAYNHHPVLEKALHDFTNKGMMMVGSTEALNVLLTNLYRAVYPYSLDPHSSLGYNVGTYYYVLELAQEILSKINKTAYVTIQNPGPNATVTLNTQAPQVFGLPYGVFPLQFREGSGAFGEVLDKPAGVGQTDVTKFSYPPSLWYFVNSPLASSAKDGLSDYYKSIYGSWNNILSQFEAQGIQTDSKAAAVRKPLQYGVGRLILRIGKTATSTVADSRSSSFSVVNNNRNNFPLTGVVIADQYPVGWNFEPDTDGQPLYIYDTQVNDGSTPKAYISYGTASQDVSVLVLESPALANVHFALEFQNRSNATLYGINDCAIYPGNHFYLIGYMNYAQARNATGEDLRSVFVQDHTTVVNLTIPHLRNAYTVLPDLSDPQLVLGVDAQVNWIMEKPGTIPVK